jgi:hypothetical protein
MHNPFITAIQKKLHGSAARENLHQDSRFRSIKINSYSCSFLDYYNKVLCMDYLPYCYVFSSIRYAYCSKNQWQILRY